MCLGFEGVKVGLKQLPPAVDLGECLYREQCIQCAHTYPGFELL